MTTITVKTRSRTYPVFIADQGLDDLRTTVAKVKGKNKVHLIYDAQLYALHGRRVERALRLNRGSTNAFVIPSGEKSKSTRTAEKVCDYLLYQRISRDDLVLAVGGGVTSDIAGYAASTVMRGVRWGVVPTTLLGMVDAAIGGKTGVNHKLGKNLIGTFWQPEFVYVDPGFLFTLNRREIVAGLGEVFKYAGLIGGGMLRALGRFLDADDLYRLDLLSPLIADSCRYKSRVVSSDEREAGVRAHLNLGHTFAHGIERSLGYGRLRHGEAVILGLFAAQELSDVVLGGGDHASGRLYRELVERAIRLVPKRKLNAAEIYDAMGLDKKRSGADLKYVLLERPGRPSVRGRVPKRAVTRAISRMLDFYGRHGGIDAHRPGRKRPQP